MEKDKPTWPNVKIDKVVLGLSGGMDSSTLLGHLLDEGYDVVACLFKYGSKHSEYEMTAARSILRYYNQYFESLRVGESGFLRELPERYKNILQGLPNPKRKIPTLTCLEFDLIDAFKHFKSDLLVHGGDIPEGHYEEESMSRTVVPGRNFIMSSIMVGIASSCGAQCIALGVHAGDHHIYPDCREDFIRHLERAAVTAEGIGVYAPFLHSDKHKILQLGTAYSPPVPYHLTRTCYKNQAIACGKCGSCVERLEAWHALGYHDPIDYEVRG